MSTGLGRLLVTLGERQRQRPRKGRRENFSRRNMGQQLVGQGPDGGPQEGVYNSMDLTEHADWPGLPAEHVKKKQMMESQMYPKGLEGKGSHTLKEAALEGRSTSL